MNEKLIRQKYFSKISSTKGRIDKNGMPIEMKLTFEEWTALWTEFGKDPGYPYVLSRINDLGHYETGNVFIQHVIGNATDSHGLESSLDKLINEYTIKTGYKRSTVKRLIKRGELKL
jgi:hypothetical protein